MSAKEIINQMPGAFLPEAAVGVEAIIQYNVAAPMYAQIANGECSVHEGTHDDPTVSLTTSDEDLISILKGDMDGVTAFMTGKLQIDGDIMFAQRMNSFFDVSRVG